MIFVYLARRDKQGIRLLTVGQGDLASPIRLADAEAAGLDPSWRKALAPHIDSSVMSSEVWIESAQDFPALAKRLQARGYRFDPVQTPVAWVRSASPTGQGRFTPGDRPAQIPWDVLKRMEARSRTNRRNG